MAWFPFSAVYFSSDYDVFGFDMWHSSVINTEGTEIIEHDQRHPAPPALPPELAEADPLERLKRPAHLAAVRPGVTGDVVDRGRYPGRAVDDGRDRQQPHRHAELLRWQAPPSVM